MGFSKGPDLLVGKGFPLPAVGVLDENLKGFAAEVSSALEGALETPSGRYMSTES